MERAIFSTPRRRTVGGFERELFQFYVQYGSQFFSKFPLRCKELHFFILCASRLHRHVEQQFDERLLEVVERRRTCSRVCRRNDV